MERNDKNRFIDLLRKRHTYLMQENIQTVYTHVQHILLVVSRKLHQYLLNMQVSFFVELFLHLCGVLNMQQFIRPCCCVENVVCCKVSFTYNELRMNYYALKHVFFSQVLIFWVKDLGSNRIQIYGIDPGFDKYLHTS